jgi:hypothetical protein
VRVSIASEDSGEINSLYDWLRADRDVIRYAKITPEDARDQTPMGALEVVTVVLTQITGLGGLALSFAAWWRSRSKPSPITLTRPDGQQLTIGGAPEVTSGLIIDFLSANNDQSRGTSQPTA